MTIVTTQMFYECFYVSLVFDGRDIPVVQVPKKCATMIGNLHIYRV